MRAFFVKDSTGWRIATQEQAAKHSHSLTVLNMPVMACDAELLQRVQLLNPAADSLLTYREILNHGA